MSIPPPPRHPDDRPQSTLEYRLEQLKEEYSTGYIDLQDYEDGLNKLLSEPIKKPRPIPRYKGSGRRIRK